MAITQAGFAMNSRLQSFRSAILEPTVVKEEEEICRKYSWVAGFAGACTLLDLDRSRKLSASTQVKK